MEGFELREALTGILTELRNFTVEFVPRLVTGLIVLLLGLILAKIVQVSLRGALRRVKFDALMDRLGIPEVLASIGVRDPVSHALSRLVYVLLVILFVQGAANAVGMSVISDAISSFFAFLPNLVAAVLILLLGNVVGQFARRAVEESGRESGVDYASAMGRAVAGAITFIVAIMAIAQLGIDTAMIRIVVIAALAGGALALGLSFGLGSREVTRHIVAGFYLRKLLKMGEELEVSDQRGIVSGVTPTKTLLEQDGRTVALPNHRLLDETTRQ